MKVEDQVCSIELSMKLRELDVPQESLFYWNTDDDVSEKSREWYISEVLSDKDSCSAFTASELGELLPLGINMRRVASDESMWWSCIWNEGYGGITNLEYAKDIKEADARAKMIIYLIENKLIKVEDLK